MKKPINIVLNAFLLLDKAGNAIPDPSNEGWPIVTLDRYEANELVGEGTDGAVRHVAVTITIEPVVD